MPKAGVAQFTGSANWEENIAAVRRLTAKAAETGVNLLCFPELANTVYVPFVENRALFALAEPESGGSVTAARAIARQHEMVLVYPFFEKDGDIANTPCRAAAYSRTPQNSSTSGREIWDFQLSRRRSACGLV
jgi:predicted amidohydrolase